LCIGFLATLVGGMQDYNYVYGDCLEITVELTCCKYPMASKLRNEWLKNKNALLELLMLVSTFTCGNVLEMHV